jgi:hypothetical protein
VEEIRKRAVTLNKKNWKIEFQWVKAQTGILGCNSKQLRNLQKDTNQGCKKGYAKRKHNKMTKSVGGNNERGDY